LDVEHDELTMKMRKLEARTDVEEDDGEDEEAAGKQQEVKFEF
jgi:hypothetical protein